LDRASHLRKEKHYEQAARIVDLVLREEPESRRARWMRAEIEIAPDLDHAEGLFRSGQRTEALHVMTRLVERLPDEPEAHLRLAPALVVEGEFDRASAHALRAAELGPGDPNVLFRAAHSARWGDTAGSRSYLERMKTILADEPDHPFFPFYDDVPHLEGLLACDEGRPEEGVAYLEQAFALQPSRVDVAGDLAEAYIRSERVEDAVNVVREGLRSLPDDERLLEIYTEYRPDSGTA
jgi:tetratricopeptide (TPR) repeat protein